MDGKSTDPLPLAVSPKHAAEMLDVSIGTIYGLLRDGRLQARKRGRSTLIATRSVHEYFESLPEVESRIRRARVVRIGGKSKL